MTANEVDFGACGKVPERNVEDEVGVLSGKARAEVLEGWSIE